MQFAAPVRHRGPRRSAWRRSSRTVRARRRSSGALSPTLPAARGRPSEVEAAWRRPQAGQRALPRLGGHDLRREVVDLLRRALHRLRPRPVRARRRPPTAGPTAEALELGCGTGFFPLNLQAGRRPRRGARHRPRPGMVEVAQSATPTASASSRGPGRRRRVDPLRRRHVRPRRRARRAAPHPRRRAGARARCCGCSSPAAGSSSRASRRGTATASPGGCRADLGAATRVTRLPLLRERWAGPPEELDESSRAAALEAVVDLHTFDPGGRWRGRRCGPARSTCARSPRS